MAAPRAGIPAVDPLKAKGTLAELATRFALTKPGTWFYSKVAARIDGPLVRLSRGRINSTLGLFPVVLLHVKGAKSGIERTVPLVYFTDGDDVILMASSFGRPRYPAWYHNLKANPQAMVSVEGDTWDAVARIAEPRERDEIYAKGIEIYPGWRKYEKTAGDRHIEAFVLSRV